MFTRRVSRGTLTAAAAVALPLMAWNGAAAAGGPGTPEWDALVKAAQAEGNVRLFNAGRMARNLRKIFPEFEKKYGVKVHSDISTAGRQQIARILAERSVGRFTMDLRIGGANSARVELIPNNALARLDTQLVDPDVTDRARWYKGKHHYSDPEGRYIFTWGASPSHLVTYNTKLVKPEEIKSYWDLVDPKWKGKVVAWSPATPGVIGTAGPLFVNPKIGEAWFRKFAELKPTIVKDARQGAEWVALGRFHLGLFGMNTLAIQLAKEGLPVRGYLPHELAEGEILSSSGANIMILNDGPNPNAAKLFVNWALSREGQQLFVNVAEITDSLRADVDNAALEEPYRVHRDREYFIAFEDEAYVSDMKDIMGTLRDIMREAGYQ